MMVYYSVKWLLDLEIANSLHSVMHKQGLIMVSMTHAVSLPSPNGLL